MLLAFPFIIYNRERREGNYLKLPSGSYIGSRVVENVPLASFFVAKKC